MRIPLLAFLLVLASGQAQEIPSRLEDPPKPEAAGVQRDLYCLKGWAEGLGALLDRAESRPGLFAGKPARWTLDEDRELRALWAGTLDHLYALEGIKCLYKTDKAGFALSYAAFLAQYAEGLRWIALAQGRKRLETLLDEPDAGRGIPKDAFADLKFRLLHVSTMIRFSRSDRRFRKEGADNAWLKAYVPGAAGRVRAILKQRGLQDLLANGADIVGDLGFEAWFPTQKAVAEWMGDTKVRRLKRTLITPEQARELAGTLRPGDVLVERRNWYLSNVGLPGFWPHAVLHVGTPEALGEAFDADPETTAWLKTLPGSPITLTAALASLAPAAWKSYLSAGEDGSPHRVLEAVSEGVIFNSIEESCCGDYLGALRPRLKPADKAQALLEAFRHWGKPYDFNFDFVTDSTLVCSELVYKAYLPAAGKAGLRLPLAEICGRQTLPPNDIIRRYDEEGDTPERQFDFVAFLDGSEKDRAATKRDDAALKSSWRRPKWDLAQK